MSCIDPKNKNTALDGFKLPEVLGSGIGDGQCMGAEVRLSWLFCDVSMLHLRAQDYLALDLLGFCLGPVQGYDICS